MLRAQCCVPQCGRTASKLAKASGVVSASSLLMSSASSSKSKTRMFSAMRSRLTDLGM